MQNIIIKPIVTEKTMSGSSANKFTFLVASFATKTDIKKAIKDAFNVHVVSVSTSTIKGKRKRIGTRRIEIKETATKKAIVMLKKGDKISLFESGTDEEKRKRRKNKPKKL